MSLEIGDQQIRRLLDEVNDSLELELTARQTDQLCTHFSLLLKWSDKINLTAIRSADQIALLHFGESLCLAKLLPQPQGLMVDIGSGAGFPGLPLKVAWPEVETLLLEPNQKKATFLKEVVRRCGLEGIEVRAERLEQVCVGELEGRAVLATMRAVAPRPRLLAEIARLLSPAGKVALFISKEVAKRLPASSQIQWLEQVPVPNSLRRVIQIGIATP